MGSAHGSRRREEDENAVEVFLPVTFSGCWETLGTLRSTDFGETCDVVSEEYINPPDRERFQSAEAQSQRFL